MAPWWRRMARRDSGDSELPGLPFRLSLTPDCNGEAHQDCAHMYGSSWAAESEVTLCACPCHESCPMQGSPILADFMLSCTCPGYAQLRRNQEQAGLDPAQVAQWVEARRQLHADPDWEKRHYVEVYEAAAAQAAGQPSPHHITFDGPPQKMMEFAVYHLAARYSEAEAARLLGLTEKQVSAAVWTMRKVDRYRRLRYLTEGWPPES
jgi:hypothetical protein